MASQSKTQTVKFEVGQLVLFSGHRVGRVSRIAKNGAIYVIVLGETTVADQASEELRVKKADLQLIEESEAQHEIELAGVCEDAAQEIVTQQAAVDSAGESIASIVEPVQSTLALESTEESQSVALAEAKSALRELTFSVTRHSILTAFIDVALNKNIAGYHHQVAGNLKNLMAAAFDPVHDAEGYARINTWTMAALELVVKNKERVAKMLSQPIEAAPIKIDRVTKLGMWLDKNMNSKGATGNALTAAYDSCYIYDSFGKKLDAYVLVAIEVAQAMDSNKVEVRPIPASINKEFSEHLTAQAAIAVRKQYIDYWRQLEPGLFSYCGIVPVYKTGASIKEAIEESLASAISSLKWVSDRVSD